MKNSYNLTAIITLVLTLVSHSAFSQTCSNYTILKYLESPVETTLLSTNAFFVADINLKKEISSTKGPLMVFVYNNDHDFSKGLAAVVTCVHSEFPNVRLIAYNVTELSQPEMDRAAFFSDGMVKSVPSLFLYRYTRGGLELAATINEGYREESLVTLQIERVSKFIQTKMLQ